MPIFSLPETESHVSYSAKCSVLYIYNHLYLFSLSIGVSVSSFHDTQGIYYEKNTRVNQYCMYIYGVCKGRPDAATPCTASLVIPESGICAWLSGFPYSTVLSVCIVLSVRVCVHVFASNLLSYVQLPKYLVVSTELQYTPLFRTQGVLITVGRWVS